MTELVVTTGAVRRAKFQSCCYHQQINTQSFWKIKLI